MFRARRLGWAGQLVAWTVILGAVGVLAVAVLVPRVAGATPYSVLTGSMRPDLPPGTLAVVRPTAFEDIVVGDVITYQLVSGEPAVVTHRVVGVGVDLTGERVLTTQGDANTVADRPPVREVQVKGELWYSVPLLGRVNDVMTGRQHHAAVALVATLLLGYALVMFGGAVRDRSRPQVLEPVDG